MTGSPRRSSDERVHPCLEVGPPLSGNLLFGLRNLPSVLPKNVEKDEQPFGSPVENSIERAAVMAPQLPKLALDLGTVREWQRGICVTEGVEAVDVVVDDHLHSRGKPIDELVDGLPPISGPIVDRMHIGQTVAALFSIPVQATAPGRWTTNPTERACRAPAVSTRNRLPFARHSPDAFVAPKSWILRRRQGAGRLRSARY